MENPPEEFIKAQQILTIKVNVNYGLLREIFQ